MDNNLQSKPTWTPSNEVKEKLINCEESIKLKEKIEKTSSVQICFFFLYSVTESNSIIQVCLFNYEPKKKKTHNHTQLNNIVFSRRTQYCWSND